MCIYELRLPALLQLPYVCKATATISHNTRIQTNQGINSGSAVLLHLHHSNGATSEENKMVDVLEAHNTSSSSHKGGQTLSEKPHSLLGNSVT